MKRMKFLVMIVLAAPTLALGNSFEGFACFWNDGWTWGGTRVTPRAGKLEVAVTGFQMASLAKFVDLTGDAWTVVDGVKFELPPGTDISHEGFLPLPVAIVAGSGSVLAAEAWRVSFTMRKENEARVAAHIHIQDPGFATVIDEVLVFNEGQCR